MFLRKSLGTLAVIGCICLPLAASALMKGLSTEKLTRDSMLIVAGEVQHTASQWTADKKSIVTTAVVTVQQVLKGRLQEEQVRVRYGGGQVGDVAMRQSDVAPLRAGEKVLLFLVPEKAQDGPVFRIQGRGQGTYSIGDDQVARKKGFSVDAIDEQMDMAIPLEKLKEKIRGYADED